VFHKRAPRTGELIGLRKIATAPASSLFANNSIAAII
jgi:hypothetical protein